MTRAIGISRGYFIHPDKILPPLAEAYVIPYCWGMTTISVTNARSDLYQLVDQVNADSHPVTIAGKRGNAVLIGEDDWLAIQETLYLSSIPEVRESIQQARKEPLSEGSTELPW